LSEVSTILKLGKSATKNNWKIYKEVYLLFNKKKWAKRSLLKYITTKRLIAKKKHTIAAFFYCR
jgi:hypothetical protein